MQLHNFHTGSFLQQHWQKSPTFIAQALKDWRSPLSPDELAGLSLEPGVESRLIERRDGQYHAEHGPLPESRFADLGDAPYTLLVQAADHHAPMVAALLDAFRFIPNWRIDDVMISYANKGGGVGAHFDQYDVFLLQGAGRRRWRIGQKCDENSTLIPHDDLRLLAEFECEAQYDLGPGDMLYVPPGIAHEGTALDDDCMTYSIGFRAPSRADLIDGFSEYILDRLSEDDRYNDAQLTLQDNPGEISQQALAHLHQLALEKMGERDEFIRWFGQHNSAPKYPDMDWAPQQPITARDIAKDAIIMRNPASRFAFTAPENGPLLLFIDGEIYEAAASLAEFAKALCGQSQLPITADMEQDMEIMQLIAQLHNRGAIAVE